MLSQLTFQEKKTRIYNKLVSILVKPNLLIKSTREALRHYLSRGMPTNSTPNPFSIYNKQKKTFLTKTTRLIVIVVNGKKNFDNLLFLPVAPLRTIECGFLKFSSIATSVSISEQSIGF